MTTNKELLDELRVHLAKAHDLSLSLNLGSINGGKLGTMTYNAIAIADRYERKAMIRGCLHDEGKFL